MKTLEIEGLEPAQVVREEQQSVLYEITSKEVAEAVEAVFSGWNDEDKVIRTEGERRYINLQVGGDLVACYIRDQGREPEGSELLIVGKNPQNFKEHQQTIEDLIEQYLAQV